MLGWLKHERHVFRSHPKNMRILLLSFMVYGFIMPVNNIFAAAYIMRNTDDVSKVMVYQLMTYSGFLIASFLNGFLLNRFKCAHLFAFGMVLSGVSLFAMTSIPSLEDTRWILFTGLMVGIAFGFYWANRAYLILKNTHDANRSYYQGVESFAGTLYGVVVPACIGWVITHARSVFGLTHVNQAYQWIMGVVFILTVIAGAILLQGTFEGREPSRFIYFRFHRVWWQTLVLNVLRGMMHGFLVTAPAMLIMTVMKGDEGDLGLLLSLLALILAIMMYLMGRNAKPRHWLSMIGIGTFLLVLGTCVNGIFFDSLSALFLIVCLMLVPAFLDIAYMPIQMNVIEYVARIEQRMPYVYILSQECGFFMGRLLGCGFFILVAVCMSGRVALQFVPLAVALIHVLVVPLTKQLLAEVRSENADVPYETGSTDRG